MLEKCNYIVTEANDGSAALSCLSGCSQFDVILVDYAMPEMDGLEFFRLLAGSRG
jgi:CheY-like chemotaxis protein